MLSVLPWVNAQAEETPHHLSLLLGITGFASSGGTGLTFGVDYEYALTPSAGLGVVLERADGDIEATSLFAVADIHLTEQWVLQVGPGIEWGEEEDVGAFRLGGYFEMEVHEWTLSTTLAYDIADGEDDTYVLGVLLGFKF